MFIRKITVNSISKFFIFDLFRKKYFTNVGWKRSPQLYVNK